MDTIYEKRERFKGTGTTKELKHSMKKRHLVFRGRVSRKACLENITLTGYNEEYRYGGIVSNLLKQFVGMDG